MIKKIVAACLALISGVCFAQSNPGLYYGQTPTPGQWNSYFSAKMDYTIPLSNGNCLTSNGSIWTSVPCTGQLLTVQTITGTSHVYVAADLYSKTRRSNSGTSMTDTMPASSVTGMVNGAQINIANVDSTATDTISAGAGTTIIGGSSFILQPGRDLSMVYDAPNTAWRAVNNTGDAVLFMGTTPTGSQLFAGSSVPGASQPVTIGTGLTLSGSPLTLATAGGGGTVTSVAETVPVEFSISGSPITTSGTLAITKATETANTVWAGPTTGAAAQPTFRALVGADLPTPGASSLGGIFSLASSSHNFLTGLATSGALTSAQPAFSDLSGSEACGQTPAFTGDATKSAGSCTTAVGSIGGQSVSLGGAFSMSGAYTFAGNLTGNTAVTFPTSGTLLAGNQTITLSGDTTGSGTTAITTTTGKVDGVTYPSAPSANTVPVVTSAVGGGTVTYEAVPNAALANSSMTIAGHSISLGGTQTIACGDLSNGATGCSTAIGTSGATIPLLNANNFWSGQNIYSIGALFIQGSGAGTTALKSGSSSGAAQVITFPDATDTVTLNAATQTLTNKSIAGSEINSGTVAATYLPTATTGALGVMEVGTGLSVTSGVVTPTFGTAANQVVQGGVITAGGPTGGATVAPIITYNAAGQLTAVSSATITPSVGNITGFGTGVSSALGTNVGSAGSVVVNGGALGTPSSGTLTNASGLLLSGLASQATNTVVGNATSGSASPTALSMTSCSTADSAVTWTTNTGFGCNTSIAANTATSATSATSATTATNIANGTANQIPYQTGAGATSFFSASNYGIPIYGATGVPSSLAGAAGVLQGSASGTPSFTTTPTLTGTNFTGVSISTAVSGLGTGVATVLANAVTGSGAPVAGTSPTVSTPVIDGYTEGSCTPTITAGAITITATTVPTGCSTISTLQKLSMIANTTVTLPAPSAGVSYTLLVCASGAYSPTFVIASGTLSWSGGSAPTPTATSGKCDLYSFVALGSSYLFGSGVLNFTGS